MGGDTYRSRSAQSLPDYQRHTPVHVIVHKRWKSSGCTTFREFARYGNVSSCQIPLSDTRPAFHLILCLFQAVQLLWEHQRFLLLTEAWGRRDLVYSANLKNFRKPLSYLFPEFKELLCRNGCLKSLQNTLCFSEFLSKWKLLSLMILPHRMIVLYDCFRDRCVDWITKYTLFWGRIFLSHLVFLNYVELFE